MSAPIRVRFAPSPTGHLHVGNARTALFNWLLARGAGGVFVLRIEDTDRERSTAESYSGIIEDLAWLGLDWDEGPGRGGPHGPYRQSERARIYADAARDLLDRGAAYRCFCSPEEVAAEREAQRAAGLPPRYGGRCRRLDPEDARRRGGGEPHVLRFRASADLVVVEDRVRGRVEFPGSQIGDPVIMRGDGTPTYNFAVVVDDVKMRITHVVRGEDHLSNTPRQMLIYQALGAPVPIFAHLSMVLGADGAPLSKRHGAASVAEFREGGVLPSALANYLALLGWAHPEGKEILSMDELASSFSLERLSGAAAMFDPRKLAWLNAYYLRHLPPERLLEACGSGLVEAGYLPARGEAGDPLEAFAARALEIYSGQMESTRDAAAATRGLFRFEEQIASDEGRAALAALASEATASAVVLGFAEAIEARRPPLLTDRDAFRETAAEVGRKVKVRGRALYHPIRIALTGAEQGPELDRLIPLIEEGSGLSLPSPILPCSGRARLAAARLGPED